jgi:perosamine synthetase
MSSPDVTDAEREAVMRALHTPVLSIGPYVQQFEQRLSAFVGARYGVAVNSGTSGLHLSVIAAGVTECDLVVTTPFSFIASANCILYERGIPIFVDVDPLTGNIDPEQVYAAISDLARGGMAARRWLPPALRNGRYGRVKAILAVHAFGQPADMTPIVALARRRSLVVIEDACEALGSEYRGHPAGTLGDLAVFAFYPNKQITTGEGGMIVTNNEEWAVVLRSLRNQGRDVFDAWLNHTRLGFNYRLDELSAALGCVQMQRIHELLAKRARVAAWYNERLVTDSRTDRATAHQRYDHGDELVRLCGADQAACPTRCGDASAGSCRHSESSVLHTDPSATVLPQKVRFPPGRFPGDRTPGGCVAGAAVFQCDDRIAGRYGV